ncbi:S46 family peptidase, partial [Corynebacterium casei]
MRLATISFACAINGTIRFLPYFGSDSDNWIWPRHTGDFS